MERAAFGRPFFYCKMIPSEQGSAAMILRLTCLLTFVVLLSGAANAATPSPRLSCNLFGWKNVERFDSVSAMQPRVVKFFLDRLAAQANAAERADLMAERDAAWQATDAANAGAPLPIRRFIEGLKFGNRWFVWYERGGKNPTTHVVAYDNTPSSPAPILVGHLTTVPGDLCAVTRALLTARMLPRGGLDSGGW